MPRVKMQKKGRVEVTLKKEARASDREGRATTAVDDDEKCAFVSLPLSLRPLCFAMRQWLPREEREPAQEVRYYPPGQHAMMKHRHLQIQPVRNFIGKESNVAQ